MYSGEANARKTAAPTLANQSRPHFQRRVAGTG